MDEIQDSTPTDMAVDDDEKPMLADNVEDLILQFEPLVNRFVSPTKTILDNIKKMTSLMKSSETRIDLSAEQWEPVIHFSRHCLCILYQDVISETEFELLTEFLRFLRNCCAGSFSNQSNILYNQDLSQFTKSIILCFMERTSPEEILITRICIQLFGNVLVGNECAISKIWSFLFGEHKLKELFQHPDVTIQEYTMMVFYNLMCEETCRPLFQTRDGHQILLLATNILLEREIDWGTLVLEHFLTKPDFMSCCDALPLRNRLLILGTMEDRLKSSNTEGIFPVHLLTLHHVKLKFIVKAEKIYTRPVSELESYLKEPGEMLSMLSVLCWASTSDAYISFLQRSTKLLETCVEALKCVHLLGRAGNIFLSLADMSQISAKYQEEMASHPLYGFKKDMIRLIGNMCFNCKPNQDLVTSLCGIELILDCCKYDAKNPYITQWAIFAIRNILENNAESQAILSSISVRGEIVNPSLLNNMGFKVVNNRLTFRSRPSAC